MYKIRRFRDLTVMDYMDKELVIACDSSGAIGNKPNDIIKVDPYVLGRFLVRVPLMELLSVGAKPFGVMNTLSVEMEPTGRSIIAGIIDELRQIELDENEVLNGSTEDNFPTLQTGAGVTVIGVATEIADKSMVGDILCCIGYPKVGDEVKLDDSEICDLPTMRQIRATLGVHEIVPVGSKGIRYETEELLKRNQATLLWEDTHLPLVKAAGPSTCAIVTVEEHCLEELKMTKRPVFVLGRISN
ncbi:AIR synthase related protein [Brevibacillus ginsengisoli]|uniref:AIR synthase related protein n=1 Tax=Brevibacillus ginsengisoli TaxID=363854 RepID=UPI003CEF61BA